VATMPHFPLEVFAISSRDGRSSHFRRHMNFSNNSISAFKIKIQVKSPIKGSGNSAMESF